MLERRAGGMAEARIGARDDVGELGIGEGVADEGPHHAKRDLLVGQTGERGDIGLGHARQLGRHIEPAVARKPVSIASSNVSAGA
jgi:hypothetical protein